MESVELVSAGAMMMDGEQPRKLAVLGLPWETSEEKLRAYFSAFGALEHAEVMKDRYTGKSRGFGFVTFMEPSGATRALLVEHTIDGRRCEAKIALPKGEPSPPRTTRIFVARIPPSVTEQQFKQYFESFGKLQDAYMPKDHSKQGYRGIGFVTFASPDSVEKVMASKHWLNGHEIAIDRATPKEETASTAAAALRNSIFTQTRMPPLVNGQRRSFDNGSGIIGPGLANVVGNGLMAPGGIDATTFNNLRSLSEDRDLSSIVGRGIDMLELNPSTLATTASLPMGNYRTDSPNGLGANGMRSNGGLGMNLGMGGLGASSQQQQQQQQANAAAAAAAATTAALQSLAKNGQLSDNVNGINAAHMSAALSGMNGLPLAGLNADLSSNLLSSSMTQQQQHTALQNLNLSGQTMLQELNQLGAAAAMQQMMAAAATGRRSLDSTLKRMENPAIASARAGPRIFIGKLTKDTSEADVKDYLMRFGYVMDVYLPKAKDNKAEHRGFGFVTFETDAAIQRVVSHGQHRLKGSTIAIDIAMPKVEDAELPPMDHGPMDTPSGLSGFGALPNMLVQRI